MSFFFFSLKAYGLGEVKLSCVVFGGVLYYFQINGIGISKQSEIFVECVSREEWIQRMAVTGKVRRRRGLRAVEERAFGG